jgi:hypothetical protein
MPGRAWDGALDDKPANRGSYDLNRLAPATSLVASRSADPRAGLKGLNVVHGLVDAVVATVGAAPV